MSWFLILFFGIFIFSEFFDFFIYLLNFRYSISSQRTIPYELKDLITENDFINSRNYFRDSGKFSIFQQIINFILSLVFIFLFSQFEKLSYIFNNYYISGLFFFFLYYILTYIISIPFSIYDTFIIEEKYGFNKTTPKLFISDLLKSLLITLIIGGLCGFVILYVIKNIINWWLPLSFIIIGFNLIVIWLYPILILPIFNKFTPLENESLKKKIFEISKKSGFETKNIFVMDASKRSSKGNAFFTGFGKNKKIVIFDTLINEYTEDELLGIFAHEAGHYKKKHIQKTFIFVVLMTFIMSYFLWYMSQNTLINEAFNVNEPYTILVYASILFSSIFTFVGYSSNFISRKHEFEADRYSHEILGSSESLISALKKLSKLNYSNLTPHPLYVILNYSHPTIVERVKFLKKL